MKSSIYITLVALFSMVLLSSYQINEPHKNLQPDAVIDTMDIMEVLYYLHYLEYDPDSTYRVTVLRQMERIWRRVLTKEDNSIVNNITRTIIKVGITFDDPDFVIRLMSEVYRHPESFNDINRFYMYKSIAMAYNKKGDYLTSMKYFEKTLDIALKTDSNMLIRDSYHHLRHEYFYLSMEDTSLLQEFFRINEKSIYYNSLLDDKASLSINMVHRLRGIKDLRYCRHEFRKLLAQIPRQLETFKYYHYALLQEYAYVMMSNQEYQECLDILIEHDVINNFENKNFTTTMYALSYSKLGQVDSARKYALRAFERFKNDKDQDEVRIILIYLPDVLNNLGLYKEAYHVEDVRNKEIYRQFVDESIAEAEESRFSHELGDANTIRKKETSKNYRLFAGLGLLIIILSIVVYTIIKLQKLNRLIKTNKSKLSINNEKLKIANNELESFAYASAHDIKNPLNTVSGFLQLIELDPDNKISDESRNYLNDIDINISNINNLIQSILKYAQVNGDQKIETQKVDLDAVLNQVKVMLHAQINESNAKIITPRKLPAVRGVPELLGQVILNIVSNAIKYHRKGIDPVIIIRYKNLNDGNYRIDFQDNGIGIPDAALEKIFSLFSRADNTGDYDGVGVGLAVVKKIMKLHNGSINAKNNLGHGSTFSLTLPRYEESIIEDIDTKLLSPDTNEKSSEILVS